MTPLKLSLLGVLLFVSASCGASAPSLRAIVHYDDVVRPELGGRPFPLPLTQGSVAGHPTTVILDTGAQVSVISSDLARAAGLDVVDSDIDGRDPGGQRVVMMRADHASIALEGFGLIADRPVVVVDLPPIFAFLGIGAIVSVQSVVGAEDAVVFDLTRNELARFASMSEAMRRLDAFAVSLTPRDASTSICISHSGGVTGRTLAVDALVDGLATKLELDTGASDESFAADTDVGRAIASAHASTGESTETTAAGSLANRNFEGVSFRVGDLSMTRPVRVSGGTADETCGWTGRISIKTLRRCAMAVSETSFAVRCLDDAAN